MSNASDPTANDRAESLQTCDPGRNPHLTDDQLTMVVDRYAASGEWTAAQGHLAGCARCRAEVAQLLATRDLLRALPPPRSRRSFRLTEAEARAAAPRWRSWGRLLLPGMAGLRVATATVALLLLAVTATDVLTNRDQGSGETARSSQPVSAPNAGQALAQSTAPPPTAAMVQAAVVR
ncbi:MAG: anti-sigma factor family protein, partial [Thermomicrobiales bacterium]